ncbi:hypothetical protein [Methanoregula sp.]|uniref:hypothetical protein n=1 Tax=Methanoregula sp. TaxID=2052170 RepID=UPI003BB0163B
MTGYKNPGTGTMFHDTEKTIKDLAAGLWALPIGDYLSSENFLLFCRHHDLADIWREYLDLSHDIPHLYGSAVIKNTLVLFLHHIFHSRPKDFLTLFTLLLMDFYEGNISDLPVGDLKKDLVLLGYSDQEIEYEFSSIAAKKKETLDRGTKNCPD